MAITPTGCVRPADHDHTLLISLMNGRPNHPSSSSSGSSRVDETTATEMMMSGELHAASVTSADSANEYRATPRYYRPLIACPHLSDTYSIDALQYCRSAPYIHACSVLLAKLLGHAFMVGQKVSLIIVAVTLPTANQLPEFLAHYTL